jgi:hypothetical protein
MNGTYTSKADLLGTLASSLCMVHCLATPFLFIAQTASASSHEVTPVWWSSIDYILLAVSFFAVLRSSQTSSILWVKYALWISWITLALIILNEKLELFSLSEIAIYIPAGLLVLAHLYNRRNHKCVDDKYC